MKKLQMQLPPHTGREHPEKPATEVLSGARESLPHPKGAAPNLQPVLVFLILSLLQIFFQENEKSGFLRDCS